MVERDERYEERNRWLQTAEEKIESMRRDKEEREIEEVEKLAPTLYLPQESIQLKADDLAVPKYTVIKFEEVLRQNKKLEKEAMKKFKDKVKMKKKKWRTKKAELVETEPVLQKKTKENQGRDSFILGSSFQEISSSKNEHEQQDGRGEEPSEEGIIEGSIHAKKISKQRMLDLSSSLMNSSSSFRSNCDACCLLKDDAGYEKNFNKGKKEKMKQGNSHKKCLNKSDEEDGILEQSFDSSLMDCEESHIFEDLISSENDAQEQLIVDSLEEDEKIVCKIDEALSPTISEEATQPTSSKNQSLKSSKKEDEVEGLTEDERMLLEGLVDEEIVESSEGGEEEEEDSSEGEEEGEEDGGLSISSFHESDIESPEKPSNNEIKWVEGWDETHERYFYYNKETKKSIWEPPENEEYVKYSEGSG